MQEVKYRLADGTEAARPRRAEGRGPGPGLSWPRRNRWTRRPGRKSRAIPLADAATQVEALDDDDPDQPRRRRPELCPRLLSSAGSRRSCRHPRTCYLISTASSAWPGRSGVRPAGQSVGHDLPCIKPEKANRGLKAARVLVSGASTAIFLPVADMAKLVPQAKDEAKKAAEAEKKAGGAEEADKKAEKSREESEKKTGDAKKKPADAEKK